MHNFGLDLRKLIDIKSNKQSNILAEGTFGLFSKKEDEVIFVSHDYKQILEKVRPWLHNEEAGWLRDSEWANTKKNWIFHTFFDEYDLVFHEFMPKAWQEKHRIDFINDLYNDYFSNKFNEILRDSLFRTNSSSQHMFNQFIDFKKLKNRINIQKYPILCNVVTKDDVKQIDDFIPYLFDQFEQNEFSLDVKTERFVGTQVFLAIKNKTMVNYLKLTVSENWKVETFIDFSDMICYMDDIEKIIETKFLR